MSGLRCSRCGRRILTAAVTVVRRNGGAWTYGPKCARILDEQARPADDRFSKRAQVIRKSREPEVDPRQLDLLEVLS